MVHDVIVVGSGATGGIAAKELTERGYEVLVLEAGPDSPDRVTGPSECGVTHDTATPFVWARNNQVGGRTIFWNRHTYRFSEHDFTAATLDGHGDDWPISYADLEPYYERVERFVGVEGHRDGLPHLPDSICQPAAPLNEGERRLEAAMARLWPGRNVVRARRVGLRDPAGRHAHPGYSFATSAGSSLLAARATRKLSMAANSRVRAIVMHENGRLADGVICVDCASGTESLVRGRIVFLCASTLESTRILLNSSTGDFPAGLCNSSGALGHYLMDHAIGPVVCGTIPDLSNLYPSSDVAPHFMIPRFRNIETRHPDLVRGYWIQGTIQADRATDLERFEPYPEGGHFSAVAFSEVLPRYENRVELNAGVTDRWSIPILHVTCQYGDNECRLYQDARTELTDMFSAADGFDMLDCSTPLSLPGQSIHEVGTARMGNDPRTSVLNGYCQSWDVPNVFVTDGACFVTSGSVNPTLTMMALTARAVDYLDSEYRKELR
jgi:choline dehydrogenase-like flavoprotein